jgi:DNA invertase Pin-like site-specific DNA recombinase
LVQRNGVDLVITESVDRLSRDVGDLDRLRKQLAHHGVELVCLDGTRLSVGDRSSALLFGVKSLFAEQYLSDLADKTRRGLEGRARAGAPTGAVAFGYRIVPTAEGKTIEVDPAKAAIVARIFRDYARGRSFAGIARDLNAEGVEPPRAHSRRTAPGWMDSCIRSMLRNQIVGGPRTSPGLPQ